MRKGIVGAGIALLLAAGASWWVISGGNDDMAGDGRIPIGVLGDSDSHAYHDDVRLSNPRLRGGDYRATTFQWTEVLARLRGTELDLGEWGTWGARPKVAMALGALGLENRSPRKRDFRYNFAVSSASCTDLVEGHYRQAERLLYLMRKAPERWARGAIVIRIGNWDIGQPESLERYARTGLDDEARRGVARCTEAYRRAIAMIRAEHPKVALVVVTTSDNRDLPANHGKWRDPAMLARIGQVLEQHERELSQLCAADARCALWNDREWFTRIWGTRDAAGAPAYREASLGGPTAIAATQGDHPGNAVLADNHAGAVFNGLWARDLAALLRERFAMPVTPIREAEIAALLDPKGELGIAPRAR